MLNKQKPPAWCLIALRSPAELPGRKPLLKETQERSSLRKHCLLIGWFYLASSCLHITLLRGQGENSDLDTPAVFSMNANLCNWSVVLLILQLALPLLYLQLSTNAHWFVCVWQQNEFKSGHIRHSLSQTLTKVDSSLFLILSLAHFFFLLRHHSLSIHYINFTMTVTSKTHVTAKLLSHLMVWLSLQWALESHRAASVTVDCYVVECTLAFLQTPILSSLMVSGLHLDSAFML